MRLSLLTFAWVGFLLPLIWIRHAVLAFADYAVTQVPLPAGTTCLARGLWLFHLRTRTWAPTGRSRSGVLEKHKFGHARGVYPWVSCVTLCTRLSWLYSVGQALVIPNYIAGLSSGVAMASLVGLRIRPEEWIMLEEFGRITRSMWR